MTELPNRVAFREAVELTLAEARGPFSVLLMDLDRFKEINDTLGHHYGDLLLQQVAQRLRERLPADALFARLGGDEFAILSKRPGRGDAVNVAHQVAGALRPPFELEEIVVDVQASIGIALFPDDGIDVDALLQRADVAMYRAKETRADVAVYDESYDQHSPRKLALSADLRQALQHRAIVPWFQPELDLATGDVIVLEALARWPHPQLGLLQPAAFLEMSEHTNLIKPLTELILEKALCQVAEWESLSLDVAVAVNISPAMLMDPRFVELVLSSLANSGMSPERLKLEVTESALMADPLLSREILQELSRRGIHISIDDFGTGYSSLAYLADLPVSEVKIDRSFVGKMTTGSKESIIVNSTIDLAHHLGLRAVAEGVESVELLQHLRRLGCDVAQGYAIGRPMSGGQATSWLTATQRLRDGLKRRRDVAA